MKSARRDPDAATMRNLIEKARRRTDSGSTLEFAEECVRLGFRAGRDAALRAAPAGEMDPDPMDRPGLPYAEQCHCGSGKVPHRFGKHESCESYKHHCDGCHERRACTLHDCIASFNAGEMVRREDVATAKLEAIGELLARNGCDCDCDCDSDGHGDDCMPCFACQVQGAMTDKPTADRGGR
jgi:hypothetical protein